MNNSLIFENITGNFFDESIIKTNDLNETITYIYFTLIELKMFLIKNSHWITLIFLILTFVLLYLNLKSYDFMYHIRITRNRKQNKELGILICHKIHIFLICVFLVLGPMIYYFVTVYFLIKINLFAIIFLTTLCFEINLLLCDYIHCTYFKRKKTGNFKNLFVLNKIMNLLNNLFIVSLICTICGLGNCIMKLFDHVFLQNTLSIQ